MRFVDRHDMTQVLSVTLDDLIYVDIPNSLVIALTTQSL